MPASVIPTAGFFLPDNRLSTINLPPTCIDCQHSLKYPSLSRFCDYP